MDMSQNTASQASTRQQTTAPTTRESTPAPNAGPTTRHTTAKLGLTVAEKTAQDFLNTKQQLPDQYSKADIYAILKEVSKMEKREHITMMVTIKHCVVILELLDKRETAQEIAEAVMSSLCLPLEQLKSLTDIGETLRKTIGGLSDQVGNLNAQVEEKLKATNPKTYATTVTVYTPPSQTLPTPNTAFQVERVKAQAAIQQRQVLLLTQDNGIGRKLADSSNANCLDTLNTLLEVLNPPQEFYFVAARKMRDSKNWIVEMNSLVVADWLRNEQAQRYTTLSGNAVLIAQKDHIVISFFVPVTFSASDEHSIHVLERDNDLPKGSITKVRWVNGVGKKDPDQNVAHLYIYLNSPEAANKLVTGRLLIEGSRCKVERKIQGALRCFHCSELGHLARECPRLQGNPADIPTCGVCGEGHLIKHCKAKDKVYCVNCKTDDHTSRDRSCPAFKNKCEEINCRKLTNTLPYFPTEEDWTWELEPANAPRAGPHPRVTQRPKNQQRQTTLYDAGWPSRPTPSTNAPWAEIVSDAARRLDRQQINHSSPQPSQTTRNDTNPPLP
ncbi:hypothetical protein D9758_006449 [Tetrapyrgos nigripes]|uniref:CCHC-type domain-containing protein n=1 Tax=Tetrapyrgos nigripes TaxID=182062 RepID=A0A8H5LRG7_9AGAR|nr:hypothetical protein D9758_006449 [Tetrapyrgos nigripes]